MSHFLVLQKWPKVPSGRRKKGRRVGNRSSECHSRYGSPHTHTQNTKVHLSRVGGAKNWPTKIMRVCGSKEKKSAQKKEKRDNPLTFQRRVTKCMQCGNTDVNGSINIGFVNRQIDVFFFNMYYPKKLISNFLMINCFCYYVGHALCKSCHVAPFLRGTQLKKKQVNLAVEEAEIYWIINTLWMLSCSGWFFFFAPFPNQYWYH